MGTPFLSSEDYDDQAHKLYNAARYDEALKVLREGLSLYPHAVELHVGVGYARLAREEFAWARKSFEEALVLDADHEDALAGLGETLLQFNQKEPALKAFRRVLELGYEDDLDLMLQCGRALFREGLIAEAREFFDIVVKHAPDSAEGMALVGYCQHRLGADHSAMASLRKALDLDNEHAEARIYLANILYDRSQLEEAYAQLEGVTPEEHWDELGIWRYIEMSVSLRGMREDDPALKAWHDRLAELAGEPDATDTLLDEIEQRFNQAAERQARGQLELFGAMLADLAHRPPPTRHRVELMDGRAFEGTWEEIVQQMRNERGARAGKTLEEFMQAEARRASAQTGIPIPASDAESFIRGSADAGILRILT
jgi:tetratricopeptide (TPR) repeat protein